MSFKQSTIAFGGYTFPAGFRVVDVETDTIIDEVKIPFLDGTSAPIGSRSSKVIHISGTIGGFGAVDSSGNNIMTSDQADAEFQTMVSYLESGYQQLSFGQSPARYLNAQKRKLLKTALDGAGRRALQVDLELIAQDPRWLSIAVHTVTPTLVVGGNATNAVTNAGTAITYPKLTLTCAGSGASIVNPAFETEDSGGHMIVDVVLTYTMAPGDTIIIDCDPRNRLNAVQLNGVSRLDLLGTSGITNGAGNSAMFPYLNPGAGYVVVGTGAGSVLGTSSASVTFQDAWL